jgi:hypothetical protein
MITVSAFLSYADSKLLVQRFDEKTQEYDGLYNIDEFIDRYGDEGVNWFSITNGNGYLVIVLEGSK